MNISVVIGLCLLCLLVGYELGSWKEGKEVRKATEDLSAFHYKEIQFIVDKILKSRGKGGE